MTLPAGSAEPRRTRLDSGFSPGQALSLLAGKQLPFALTGSWTGGGAILGSGPVAVSGPGDDPFALLDRQPDLPDGTGPGFVGGGWFGWLGYGAGARIERLPPQPPRPVPLPETHLAFYDHILRLDPSGVWWFEALVTSEREGLINRRQEELERLMVGDPEATGLSAPGVPAEFRPSGPVAGHLAAVERCRERIRAGEFFQANLRLRLEAMWEGDPAALFAVASEAIEPAHGAFFSTRSGAVVSLSPELFLRRRGSLVETGPIKGTIRRPEDELPAEAARRRLLDSPKDAAEHVMIVDVARNDLGRVCEPGSVTWPERPGAEPHPGLWHLVSTVSGRLRTGAGDSDLLRATFPPCSVTGAPKIQAMRAIAGLEPLGREVFTGAIGFASPASGLELSVAIRTFEAADGRLWLDVGGGIVADSDPGRELEECLAKGRPLIEAIGSRIAPQEKPPDGTGPDAVARLPWPLDREGERPDPASGLIETIRVEGGRALNRAHHLGRLDRSLSGLYGAVSAAGLDGALTEAAERLGTGALRLEVNPGGDFRIVARGLPRRELPVVLSPFVIPGGLGSHKWADRRLVDRLSGAGPTPLLVDRDGSVLEAAWGNVWIEYAGVLLTPPADGRILPGVTRELVLEAGKWRGMPVRVEPVGLGRLTGADRILVSSSLAGLVPAMLAA